MNQHRFSMWILVISAIVICFTSWFALFQRTLMFDFVDEYNNIVAGWFMLQGRELYSEIFFNRQPLPAILSAGIQLITSPQSIYEYILYHRLFMIGYSIVWVVALILRFRHTGLVFAMLYESQRLYLFGFTFQAEGMIAYPIAYLTGLVLYGWQSKRIYVWEHYIVALLTWFCVFSREPYAPLTLVLSGLFYFRTWTNKQILPNLKPIILLTVLSLYTVFLLPLGDYVNQLYSINRETIVLQDIEGSGGAGMNVLKTVFYPVYILLGTHYSHLLSVQMMIVISLLVLLCLAFVYSNNKRQFVWVGVIFAGILTLAAVRPTPPGDSLYGAYRIIPWWSVLLMGYGILVQWAYQSLPKHSIWIIIPPVLIGCYIQFAPASYFWEKVADRQTQYSINYSKYYVAGEFFKQLANPQDKLHVYGFSSLIHLGADLPAAYPYALYYPIIFDIPEYTELLKDMYIESPPEFLYECNDPQLQYYEKANVTYSAIMEGDRPTCMYVKNDITETLPPEGITFIRDRGFDFIASDEANIQ